MRENLEMGAFLRRDSRASPMISDGCTSLLSWANGSPHVREACPAANSRCVAIARGLMARPRILLMDEPSLGLSPILVEQIFGIIADIKSRGITVLLVEQNAHMALSVADRGDVIATGEIDPVRYRPGTSGQRDGEEALPRRSLTAARGKGSASSPVTPMIYAAAVRVPVLPEECRIFRVLQQHHDDCPRIRHPDLVRGPVFGEQASEIPRRLDQLVIVRRSLLGLNEKSCMCVGSDYRSNTAM